MRNSRSVHIAILFASLTVVPTGIGVAEEMSTAEAGLRKLGVEYDQLWEGAFSAADEQPQYSVRMSDERFLELYYQVTSKPSPDSQVLPRLLEFAKANSETSFAFDALAFSIWRGGPATGELHGTAWRIKEEALELVRRDHMDDPRIAQIFALLAGSIPSERTEEFLRYGYEKGQDRQTRAAAGLALAKYLHNRNRYERRSSLLVDQIELGNSLDRHWKLIVTPYLKKLPYDAEKASAEIERLLQAIVLEYSDVEALEWRFSGPGKILLEAVPQERRKSYSDLARSLMDERRHLAPGQMAREISGTDSDSTAFQLSDYYGKAVLLTFSANWCPSCKTLYPTKRKLMDTFKGQPFVVLSVSRDEHIETLKTSRASGEITWRCWWDGRDGPISESWHVVGAPSIFLLDPNHVILDTNLSPNSSLEEFERAIQMALRSDS